MNMENLIGETTEYDKKAALEVRKPKSWCKSVSAFANTLGGALIFGMADDGLMLSRLVDTFFSRTSWTMLLYAENHSISVA